MNPFLLAIISLFIFFINDLKAQDGVQYLNKETSDYVSSMKNSNYTYLVWDRNDDADGHFIDHTRPNFFYWDQDDAKLHFLIDTGNMEKLNAFFNSLELKKNFYAGTSNGKTGITDNTTFNNPAGIFVGDGGSIIDNNDLGLNIISRTNMRFYVDEGSGTALQAMFIDYSNANVGIGTTTPSQKLSVAGTINSEEIIVEENVGADFVFEASYDLPSLQDIEAFIEQNQHLPGIAPASQMIEEGVKVGELQMQLLQKIEELTLYTIEQEKKIEFLLETNKALLTRIIELESD